MSSRTVELIFRTLTDEAAENVAKLRKELEELKKLQDKELNLPETFKQIGDDADDAAERIGGSRGLNGAFNKLGGVVGFLGQNFLGLKGSIEVALGVGQRFYSLFIGENERLNQELLKSQANLAATSRIFVDGTEVTNPLEAVQATQETLKVALEDLAKETQSLVGVSSAETQGAFQTLVSNAGIIGTQLKKASGEGQIFNNAIEAAVPLTKSFVAATSTIGLPLQQIQQEVNSILQGQVTQDSALAKFLGLDNNTIKKLISQGTLVDTLLQKLKPFTEANALAARSVGGLTSNIRDVFEVVSRNIGEPLLEPLVNVLDEIENLLTENQGQIVQFFQFFGKVAADNAQKVLDAFAPVGQAIVSIAVDAGPAIQQAFSDIARLFGEIGQLIGAVLGEILGLTSQTSAVEVFANAVGAVAQVLTALVIAAKSAFAVIQPLIGGIGAILAPLFEFAASDFGQAFIQAAAATAIAIAAYQKLIVIVAAVQATYAAATAAMTLFNITQTFGANAAVKVVIPALLAKAAALKAVAASAAAAAAPLAVFAAGIAAIVIIRKTKELRDFNEAVEATNQAVQVAADGIGGSAIADATALKELNALEIQLSKSGKELSKQDKERQELLRSRTQLNIEGLETAIADLESQKGQSPERDKLLDVQIGSLQRQKEALEGVAGGGLGLYNQALQDLGKTQTKLANDAESQRAKIFGGEDGMGPQVRNVEDLTTATKEYLSTLSQQESLGFISSDSALSELELIRNNTQQTLETRQAAADQIEKIEKARNQNELAGIKNQQENISTLLAERQLTEVDAAKRLNEAKQAELSEQITDTQQEIERLKAQGATSNSPQVKALVEQEEELQLKLRGVVVDGINEQQKLKQQADKLELDNLKQQTQEVDTLLAERRITEEEALKRSTATKKAELNEQLKDTQEQIANLRAQGANEDSFEFQELVQQEAEIQRQLRQADVDAFNERQKLRDQANKLELDTIKRQQQEVELLVDQGELGIVEAAQRTTEARKKELDEQLEDIREQKQALIAAGANQDSLEFKEIIEQEKSLQLERQKLAIEGEKAIQEARLKELQFAQDKALDQVRLAETERLIEIQRLNAGEVENRIDVEGEKLELTRDRIEQELALEEERIALLESQRGTGSQEDQLQREDDIREARQKTADLTLQLLENESQQQQRLYDKQISAIDRAQQATKNRSDVTVQGLERESALLDALNKTYERQISLLQEEQNLRGAINGFYQSQKGLLAQINQELGKDKQAAKIREQAAEMAVTQLKEQQRIEDIILEQQIRQNEILLEQEIIQNRINQARAAAEAKQAEADLQKAQIELQKVIADPNASQGDIESASLNVDAAAIGVTAAREAVRGYQVEAGFLQDRRASLNDQARNQRQMQDIQQRQQLNQTRFDAAMAQDTKAERNSGLRSLRESVQADLNNEQFTEPLFRAPRSVNERAARQEFEQIGASLGIQPATEIPTAMGGMESLATETAKQTGILTAINDGIAKLQGLVPELNVTFKNSYGAGQERQAANDAEQMIVQSIRELARAVA